MRQAADDRTLLRQPRALAGPRYLALLTVCFWLTWAFGGSLQAADTAARPMSREFDPFDILAWEILAGIDASGDVLRRSDAREDERIRIAIRPFSAERAALPASLANAYNDKLLVALLSQGGSRYRFIAREALGVVIEEIDESSAGGAELDDLLAALVESAKADVLLVGKLRPSSDEAVVLSYEAVAVRDGTILAATSYQRLALDPVEVDLAARSDARDEASAPAARPKSDDLLDFPIAAGEAPLAEDSTASPRTAKPDREVAGVQADLWDLGYDPGPVDGLLGARTRAAIRAYQRDAGLPVDGKVSVGLIDRLRRDLSVDKSVAAARGPLRTAPVPAAPLADRRPPPVPYGAKGTYCREFQQAVTVGGAEQLSYGRACLQSDGAWKIVK
jgi:hypothetical protein